MRCAEQRILFTDRQTDRQTYRQADRQTDRHTDRQTYRQTDRHTDRQTDRQTDIQTDRHTDRQTDRQTDTQTDRQTDRDTEQLIQHIQQINLKRLIRLWHLSCCTISWICSFNKRTALVGSRLLTEMCLCSRQDRHPAGGRTMCLARQ